MITTATAREIAKTLAAGDTATIYAITDGDLALAHFQLAYELTFARRMADAYETAPTADLASDAETRYLQACEVIDEFPALLEHVKQELFDRGAGMVGW